MATYIFIDESGDPGDIAPDNSNSKYYSEFALQIDGGNMARVCEHITNWRYVRGIFREIKKLPDGNDLSKFLLPIIELNREGLIKCSGIYLDKRNYNGPYLKPSPYKGSNPLRFRNYIHRQLLEFHFSCHPEESIDIELVFDRFEMSKESLANLEEYLIGNWNLPKLKYITHVDSAYCEALQLAGQLANAIKDVKSRDCNQKLIGAMSHIQIKDITDIKKTDGE